MSAVSHDLSAVRAHQPSTRDVGPLAYAAGSDIHFGPEAEATGGREMIAHELSHVVQQGAATPADIQAAVGQYSE